MQVNAVEHTNFFENRATEYAKASTQGNWQDIYLNDRTVTTNYHYRWS